MNFNMLTRIRMLKVKVMSLAAEARIIRREERLSEAGSQQQCELHEHRVKDVRQEQRASLLAYAFLRGVPLAKVERKSATPPDWKRVGQIVEKFGTVTHAERVGQARRLAEWKAATVVAA